MSWSASILVYIICTELDGIAVQLNIFTRIRCDISFAVQVISFAVLSISVRFLFRIRFLDRVQLAGENRDCRFCIYISALSSISGSIPFLDNPAFKLFSFRRFGSGTGNSPCLILIQVRIGRRPGTISCIVKNTNTFRPIQSLAPQGIEFKLLCDPETIISGIRIVWIRSKIAPHVHRIRKIGGLIIVLVIDTQTVIQYVIFGIRISKACILKPADKRISVPRTFRRVDFSVVRNTEVHVLFYRVAIFIYTPRQCRVCIRVGVKENTVLDFSPLSVNFNAALRHCSKSVGRCTAVIDVPTLKDIASWCSDPVEICGRRAIVCGRAGTISNIITLAYSTQARLLFGVVVTIYIHPVKEGDGIDFARVVETDCSVI